MSDTPVAPVLVDDISLEAGGIARFFTLDRPDQRHPPDMHTVSRLLQLVPAAVTHRNSGNSVWCVRTTPFSRN